MGGEVGRSVAALCTRRGPAGPRAHTQSSHQTPFQDVVRRYKDTHGNDFGKFADKASFQLNDTHPTIAVPELMRVLMDENGLGWTTAWDIATKAKGSGWEGWAYEACPSARVLRPHPPPPAATRTAPRPVAPRPTTTPPSASHPPSPPCNAARSSPSPTTPCCPRPWKSGPSPWWRSCCPAICRSFTISIGASSRRCAPRSGTTTTASPACPSLRTRRRGRSE